MRVTVVDSDAVASQFADCLNEINTSSSNKLVVFALLKHSMGRITDRFGVASVLSIVGGGLTIFLGATLTTSSTDLWQATTIGAVTIFFGALLYRIPEKSIFWSLIILIVSLSGWSSLANTIQFGILTKFEEFSPLIFLGPLLTLTGGLLALAWSIPLERAKDRPKTNTNL